MRKIAEENLIEKLSLLANTNNYIEPDYYSKYDVKRGLRNTNGTGVLVGLTKIGEVHGYIMDDGEKIPDEGRLTYRGVDIKDIVGGFQSENRLGFEEVAYILLFGTLPNKSELESFKTLLGNYRILPDGFTEDMILKFPSTDIMNKLARSVLVSYSFDNNPDDLSVKNVLLQSVKLIARFPAFIAYGYQAKAHYHEHKSLYIHTPRPDLSTSENILYLIRPDNKYSKTEAEVLDLSLVLHAEHGGGNNSAFATHVVSSTSTDTYSAIAAAVSSLKGPKHGGANKKVIEMINDIKTNVSNWQDKDELKNYLKRILEGTVFDKQGLIYGMGHAIYTISDPRAVLLKEKAYELAKEKNKVNEFNLYTTIEELTPVLFSELGINKTVCANVDFYSGFVYDMLNIPMELYTPIFAVARVAGWCAHRIEQLVSESRIIRPAYKSVEKKVVYVTLKKR